MSLSRGKCAALSAKPKAAAIVGLGHAVGAQVAAVAPAVVPAPVDVDAAARASDAPAQALPADLADRLEQSQRGVRSKESEPFALGGPRAEAPARGPALQCRRSAELPHDVVQHMHGLLLARRVE